MFSRKIFGCGIAVVLALAFTACEQPTDTPAVTLTGITANYTGGSVAVNTDVNSLKSNVTVTAKYSDNTGKTLNSADYSLSGDLSASGQKTVTVTYTEGGVTKTDTFNVTVTAAPNNDITYDAAQTGGADKRDDSNGADTTAISFTFTAAVSGLTADDITVTNGTGKVTAGALTGSGTSWSLAVTVTSAGNVTVSINKSGIEAETKHVTVYKAGEAAPALTGITAAYTQGSTIIYPTTPLDDLKEGLTVKAQYTVGNEITLSAHEYELSGTLTAGASAVTVTYQGKTASFTVTVTAPKTLTGITLNTASVKRNYNLNEQLDLSGLVVTANYSDSTGATVSYTSSSPANGTTLSTAGIITITISYTEGAVTKSNTFTVTVTAPPITYTPEQTGGADKTEDSNGADSTGIVFTFSESVDSLNLSAADITIGGTAEKGTGELTGTGTTRTLAITVSEAGTATVTITKTGIEAETKHVTVYKAGETAPTLTGITAVYTQGGTVIYPDTPLDNLKAGLTVTAQYSNGDEETLGAHEYELSGTLAVGSSAITVTYEGEETTFTVTVTKALTGITLNTASVTRDYNLNEQLDLSDLDVTAHYSDGTSATVNYTSSSPANGSPLSTAGIITVTVNYTEGSVTKSNTFTVTVTVPSNTPGASMEDAIPLIVNIWADGSLPTTSDVQWFVFTATASTQYIHAAFGTMASSNGVYVFVYDSSGTTAVGSQTRLYGSGSTTRTSRSLIPEETYYIRVAVPPNYSSGTYQIGFTASTTAPNGFQIPSSAIGLTENQWANGSLPASTDVQWFTFDATASAQYIHVEFGTLTDLYVDVYDSSNAKVGYQTELYGSTTSISNSLTTGETYYIRVWPYGSSYSGNYRIAFNATPYPPGTSLIPLTENQWTDGNIPTSSDQQWFTFTATASTQYLYIDRGRLTSLYVQVYDNSGAEIGGQTYLSGANTSASRSLTSGQPYYIKVTPSGTSGGYRILFNASTVAPPVQLPTNAVPLTLNQWTDSSLPLSSDRQWFTFIATASTQWIHAAFGTLTGLYAQVYDSSGAAVGSDTSLNTSTPSVSTSSLTSGQTYYIRVRPSSSTGSGDYRIGFNTAIAPPGTITLNADQWADGNLPTGNDRQWFVFTATASTQYIHIEFGTLTQLYAQVYDSSSATSGSETSLNSSTTNISRSLTSGQTYYIRVRPYSSSYSGGYRIAFAATPYPPGTTLIPLTADQWEDGSLPTSNDRQWFTFTATASTQRIHSAFGTLTSVYVQVYNSSGAAVGSETSLNSSSPSVSTSSLTAGQPYYIRVRPDSGSGGYRIGFNTSSTTSPPNAIQLPSTTIPLQSNQWNGTTTALSDEQWYRFTATASTQYIHFAASSLRTGLYVQVYTSNGAMLGGRILFSSSTGRDSRSLTAGQTYYIRAWPYSNESSFSGTYQLAINTSTTAPSF
jgi:hypothetical protein